MENWFAKSREETEQAWSTDRKSGLSHKEVQKRMQQFGPNSLEAKTAKKGVLSRLLAQLNDFMVIILIVAAAVSFFVSYWNGDKDYVDSIIIIIIVALNAILGVIQESKAEKAFESLKKLSAPHATVIRDGKIEKIPGEDVVPGDILLLEAGDYVCADARLLESTNLKTEESSITGESGAVDKFATGTLPPDTPLGDRNNMVLSTSYVTYGKGKAIATSIGMDTQVGHIAALLDEESQGETPLQKRLGKTGKLLGEAALFICALLFLLGLLQHKDPFQMFMTSISLAVAAIPEGLPAIVTIVLAIGMQRLSKKHTIIRKLPAVETLGSAQVICSDKTGTLTQNKMKVMQVSDGSSPECKNTKLRKWIFTLATLCNDARMDAGSFVGEPTETALAEGALQIGLSKERLEQEMKRVGELPFSSERKLMSTVHHIPEKGLVLVTKGAPEVLLSRCSRYEGSFGELPMQSSDVQKRKERNGQMADQALRVIAVAYRPLQPGEERHLSEAMEKDLIFAGLIGMMDPPRPEAANAVAVCRKAGMKPVMITGDHALTAKAIGKQLGIYQPGDLVLTGAELEQTPQEELVKTIHNYSIFARVSPEHKVRIVRAFQENGKVVAMTGDGVNDAPALKAADIGCAMGKNGTEVAKGAADMILTDDNFATIVSAVQEGRNIYANIKKSVHFLLSSNIGEIIAIFSAMLFGWSTPLLPIQLLWVNLVTDSLPAIALGMDPAEKDAMLQPPVNSKESLFAGGMGQRIALEGCMIGLLALLAFGIGHIYFDVGESHLVGRTMAFAVLSISELIHAFNMRSEHSLFTISLGSNHYLIGALLIGIVLQASVIMLPSLAKIFLVTPLSPFQWGIVAFLSFVPILVVELEKALAPPQKKMAGSCSRPPVC